MKRARFLAAARNEYLAEVGYYSEIEPGLGLRLAEAVETATARALAFPLAGSPGVAESRRVLIKGFPFSLVYRVERRGILVIAVAAQAREPGFWRARLPDR